MQISYIDNSNTKDTITKIPTKLNEIIQSIINKVSDILNVPNAENISNIDWSSISSIIGTISIILILIVAIIITLYLLRAIALYQMAKKENKDFAWLAFVPFGCFFSYGIVLDKTKIFGVEIDHAYLLLPALMLSCAMPYVGCFATILFITVKYAMFYKIYESRTKNFATVLIILTSILPFISPIILFTLRKK